MVAPFIALGGIFLAISRSPWFIWGNDALSDLGHPANGAAWIFNTSLIISGIMLVIFVIYVISELRGGGRLRDAGMLALLISMIFLTLVGVYHEGYGELHWQVSVGFFLSLLAAMVLLGLSFSREAEFRHFGIFALAYSIIGLASWFVDWGGGIAIPEAISAFPGCAWVGLLAVRLYRTVGLESGP